MDKSDSKKFTEYITKLHTSQSYKKMWNYFLDLSEKDEFKNEIKCIRKKYKIAELRKDLPEIFRKGLYAYMVLKEFGEIHKETGLLCAKYGLTQSSYSGVLFDLIFTGKKKEPIYSLGFALCMVRDEEGKFRDTLDASNDKDLPSYPISIRISPYASERDIISFVKNSYKYFIEPIQRKYRDNKNKLWKIRKKPNSARDKFIYSQKAKPRKQISELVTNKFGDILDVGEIAKIISIETKRRQEL